MMLYLTILAILVTTPESCTFDFCSDDFEKNKNTYGKNHALEYIYHLWSVHGVTSSSKICRLTYEYASNTTSGCLGFLKIYLVAIDITRLLFLFCGGV
jgi:hypothetical protein